MSDEISQASGPKGEQFFRHLLDVVPVPVFYEDESGRYLGCNKAFEAFMGKNREEIVGQTIFGVLPGGRLQMHYDRDRAVLDSGECSEDEVRLPHTDGTLHDVLMHKGVFRREDGQVAGLIGAFLDISDRKRAQARERLQRRRLRSLAVALEGAEERERRRIAKELHDAIGQTLALSKLRLQMLATGLDECAAALVDGIVATLDEAIAATRTLTVDLGVPVLYSLGLEAAAEWLAQKVREDHGVTVEVICLGMLPDLGEEMRAFLFRSLRELVMNAVRHAGVATIRVTLAPDDNGIRVEVLDRGRGFDPETVEWGGSRRESFGLFSLQERLKALGGRLDLASAPGQGTRVTVRLSGDVLAFESGDVAGGKPRTRRKGRG